MFELILVASIAGSSSPPRTSSPAPPPVYTLPVTGSSSAGSGSYQPQRTSPLGSQQQQPTEKWADKMLKGIQERIRR